MLWTPFSPWCVSRIHSQMDHLTQVQTVAVDVFESMMLVTHPLFQGKTYSVINSYRRRRWVQDVCHAFTVTRNIILSYKLLQSTSSSPWCVSRIYCHKDRLPLLQTVAVDVDESTMCVTHLLSQETSSWVINNSRRRFWVNDVCLASTVTSNVFLNYKLLPSTLLSPWCVSHIHCHKEHLPHLQTVAVDVAEYMMCVTHPLS